jgi:hypothetical protein
MNCNDDHAQANTLNLNGDAQMPRGYWIVRVDVKDEEPVKRYVAGNHAIFEKFGGRYLVRAPNHLARGSL